MSGGARASLSRKNWRSECRSDIALVIRTRIVEISAMIGALMSTHALSRPYTAPPTLEVLLPRTCAPLPPPPPVSENARSGPTVLRMNTTQSAPSASSSLVPPKPGARRNTPNPYGRRSMTPGTNAPPPGPPPAAISSQGTGASAPFWAPR